MSDVNFPHWWSKYSDYNAADAASSEEVEVEDVKLMCHDNVRWDWEDEHLEAYILDVNWKQNLPYRRFAWVLGFNDKGELQIPRYAGFWFSTGEASSLNAAANEIKHAAKRARALMVVG